MIRTIFSWKAQFAGGWRNDHVARLDAVTLTEKAAAASSKACGEIIYLTFDTGIQSQVECIA